MNRIFEFAIILNWYLFLTGTSNWFFRKINPKKLFDAEEIIFLLFLGGVFILIFWPFILLLILTEKKN